MRGGLRSHPDDDRVACRSGVQNIGHCAVEPGQGDPLNEIGIHRVHQNQAGDPYRSKVLDLQSAADRVVRSTCATVGQRVIDIPPNMTTAERVRWIAARVTKLGITRDTPAAS